MKQFYPSGICFPIPPVAPDRFEEGFCAAINAAAHMIPSRFEYQGLVVRLNGRPQHIWLDIPNTRLLRSKYVLKQLLPDPDEFVIVWMRYRLLVGHMYHRHLEDWRVVTHHGLFFHPAIVRAMAILPLHRHDLVMFPIDRLVQLASEPQPFGLGGAPW
jgi:hypothetical protein